MNSITVYHNNNGKKERIVYRGVLAIQTGPAEYILGKEDCDGNGIAYSAPLVSIRLDNGESATFDADHVCILLSK